MDSGNGSGVGDGSKSWHVVAIPYPGRGHVNPMMNLCRLLAGRDKLSITVIVTEEWLELISSEAPPLVPHNIQLRCIPNVLPSERTRGDNYAEFFEAVLTRMADPVQRTSFSRRPMSSSPASVFSALYTFDAADQLPAEGDEALTFLPDVSTTHLADLLPNATEVELLRAYAREFYWFRTAHSVLMNTFDELESYVIDKIKSEFDIPVYPVGPLIPHVCPPTSPSLNYLDWLDAQPKSTVLYVSLGSFLSIPPSQMEEVAVGLINSGVPFLWVVRDYYKADCTERFENSSGMTVPWCDQLRVLCHSSVGGFLTHCGWNSTLEGVYAGVPMITFPLFWDQRPNSKLVVEEWKIGFRLKDEHENVTRELMVNKVKKLMDLDDQDNQCMRNRAAKIKETCREALQIGGSSSRNLDQFLQQITTRN